MCREYCMILYMFISFAIAVWGWTGKPLEEIFLFQVRKGFCKHQSPPPDQGLVFALWL